MSAKSKAILDSASVLAVTELAELGAEADRQGAIGDKREVTLQLSTVTDAVPAS